MSKGRHYDPKQVKEYMAQQKANRRREQAEKRRQEKDAESRKKQLLVQLDKRQREARKKQLLAKGNSNSSREIVLTLSRHLLNSNSFIYWG